MMKKIRLYHLLFIPLFAILYASSLNAGADSGVLIATDVGRQDDSTLSLHSMKVDVLIDNQHAYVKVEQIFLNHVNRVLEGQYQFDLPDRAVVADFAVWDGLTRIPGVIMEKRRAEEIYEQIKRPQQIDPGLLKQDNEQGGSLFDVKVTPIPAYGSKRLELEYTEILPVDGLTSTFSFPFRPTGDRRQRVDQLSIKLKILNDLPIGPPELLSRAYPLIFKIANDHESEAEFQANNIDLSEDLVLRYPINIDKSALSFIAYRAPEKISAYDLRDPSTVKKEQNGYFQTTVIYNQSGRNASDRTSAKKVQSEKPRCMTLLLDNSLSMNGLKITRAYEAIDFFLHKLTTQDSFNVILFNETPAAFSNQPVPVTIENVEHALEFIRNSPIGGGTAILPALKLALEQLPRIGAYADKSIVLITDGNPTLDKITSREIISEFDQLNDSEHKPFVQLYAFGIGGDTRQELLQELVAKCKGYFAQYRETEDLSARLGLFFDKIGSAGITDISFRAEDSNNFYHVYPVYSAASSRTFDGSSYAFVGRYKQQRDHEKVSVNSFFEGRDLKISKEVSLPEYDDLHKQLPRVWARARVDALLREIDLNGEREDLISEIINLSQKYKFVTPYTAFIAAPRSLLRPRVIQPGDPVIRVRTDHSIKSVLAVLPFGLVLPLDYLSSDDVWEARFLAPKNLPDGSYRFRLILTDKKGNGYQEEKSFIIDSHAPRMTVKLNNNQVRAGETLKISVDADSDTAILTARFYGAQPIRLLWSETEKRSVGEMFIPRDLPTGKYTLIVAAEDFAHNNSTIEVDVVVTGS